MHVWDENVAGRGGDEIGSCILKYLKTKGICAKKLVIFSDNCGGQNKNWNIMAIWSYLIHTKQFEEIEHYFLITGHTYLSSDRYFAKIEKYQRGQPNVYSPSHWRDIIQSCGRKHKFDVIEMECRDFFWHNSFKKWTH